MGVLVTVMIHYRLLSLPQIVSGICIEVVGTVICGCFESVIVTMIFRPFDGFLMRQWFIMRIRVPVGQSNGEEDWLILRYIIDELNRLVGVNEIEHDGLSFRYHLLDDSYHTRVPCPTRRSLRFSSYSCLITVTRHGSNSGYGTNDYGPSNDDNGDYGMTGASRNGR